MTRPVWLFSCVLALAYPAGAAGQESLTLDSAVQHAVAHNAGLQAAQAAVRESDARIREARAGYFPRLGVTESWQRGDQPVFVFGSLLSSRLFTAQNFATDALNHPSPANLFRGAVGVEQTVFDGGRLRSAVDKATIARDISSAMADEAVASVALNVTQVYGRLVAARAARRAAEAAGAAADEDLARAERRRDVGTATDADVLGLAVHRAEVGQRSIQAAGDAAIAVAELNRLMGSPIERTYEVQEPAPGPAAAAPAADVAALLAEADSARPELRRAAAQDRLAEAGRREARAAWAPTIATQAGYEVNGARFTDRASSWVVGGEVRWTLSGGGAELARLRAATEAATRARADRDEVRAGVHVEVVTALRRIETARARQAAGRSAVEQARESQRIIRERYEAGMASVNDVLRASTAVLDAELQRVSALVEAITSDALLRRALGRKP